MTSQKEPELLMISENNSKKNQKRKKKKLKKQKPKKNIRTQNDKIKKNKIETKEKDTSNTSLKEIMIIRLEEELYGIFLDYINETINNIDLIEAPNLGEFVSGITEIRKNMIPIINLSKIMGLKTEPEGKKPVIIIKISDEFFGIQIDEIIEIKEININEILPLPEIFPNVILSGAYDYKGKVVGILKLDGLLK